jgi:leucyl aminopeptidase
MALAPAGDGIDLVSVLEGMLLRAHGPTEFRKRDVATTLSKITVCVPDRAAALTRFNEMMTVVKATNMARGLADLPGNEGYPQAIVERVEASAAKAGLHMEVLDQEQAEALGMGLLCGVARGAGHPLRVLILEHRPEPGPGRKRAPTLGLVGKGLTHDTGGYNLKTTQALHELTYDKAGGMAVIGAMHAIARLQIPAHVVGVVPLLENCVDAHAYKPGDILRAMDGTTVYIDNTDAEGRLALADCLTYMKRYRPKLVVDIATLTGACSVALGEPFAGLFSNDDHGREMLLAAGRESGDLLWPLPIHGAHVDHLSDHKAQMRNTGVQAGGASSAAAFLRHFIRYPWAHVDMAGKAALQVESGYFGRGATGFGTRLLVDAARRFAAEY